MHFENDNIIILVLIKNYYDSIYSQHYAAISTPNLIVQDSVTFMIE